MDLMAPRFPEPKQTRPVLRGQDHPAPGHLGAEQLHLEFQEADLGVATSFARSTDP